MLKESIMESNKILPLF